MVLDGYREELRTPKSIADLSDQTRDRRISAAKRRTASDYVRWLMVDMHIGAEVSYYDDVEPMECVEEDWSESTYNGYTADELRRNVEDSIAWAEHEREIIDRYGQYGEYIDFDKELQSDGIRYESGIVVDMKRGGDELVEFVLVDTQAGATRWIPIDECVDVRLTVVGEDGKMDQCESPGIEFWSFNEYKYFFTNHGYDWDAVRKQWINVSENHIIKDMGWLCD